MKDELIVNIPFQKKLFGITFLKNRKVGFLFTNLSIYQFRENVKIKTSAEYKKWREENGEAQQLAEMFYAAAQSFCLKNRKKQDFKKEELIMAIGAAPLDIRTRIMEGLKKSQEFGHVESKKKRLIAS